MRPCGRQVMMEASRGKIKAKVAAYSGHQIRKVQYFVEEENEAAVLRYVDCGKHLGIFFQSDGSRRFDLRENA
jgi:hypothetical protein